MNLKSAKPYGCSPGSTPGRANAERQIKIGGISNMTNTQIEKGDFEKVENFSGRNGKVKNQFLITTDHGYLFQSYKSVIAFKSNVDHCIYLDEHYWDYSVTTGKYRNQFLGETKAETEKKIKSGEYILTDLN